MVTVSAIPDLYNQAYQLNELNLGLCYIANGVGSLLSSLSMGHVVDWNFRRHAKAMDVTITKGKQVRISKNRLHVRHTLTLFLRVHSKI
jgi:uncharacterized membrane-anchored protein YitT (DUF2179 family)